MKRHRPPDNDELGRAIPEPQASPNNLIRLPTAKEQEHYYEPYTPLIGPVATPPSQEKKKKGKAKAAIPFSDEITKLNRLRKRRYDTFIDYMLEFNGDKVIALANTYQMPEAEVRLQFNELMDDVLLGITTSSVSDLLEKQGLGKAARVALLRQHAYSEDAKVSLVAVKLASDLDGDKHDKGTSFEEFVRRVKAKG
jgi:hypothetical protein